MGGIRIICTDCKHARKSSTGIVVRCASIGDPQLAVLYGKCRRYTPRETSKPERPNK